MAKACFMYTFCHNFVPPIRFGGYSSKNADLILAWGGLFVPIEMKKKYFSLLSFHFLYGPEDEINKKDSHLSS